MTVYGMKFVRDLAGHESASAKVELTDSPPRSCLGPQQRSPASAPAPTCPCFFPHSALGTERLVSGSTATR
jgi:hypothetical protein